MMDAGDSTQGVAAVEVAHERAPRQAPAFFHGAFTGVALAAVVAQVWLAVQLEPLRGAYKDMAAAALPFVLKSWWLWGAPVAGAVAVVGLMAVRPRTVAAYVVAAAVLVGVAIATWHLAYAPLWDVAGNIQE
jgi:hypothetical protein